MKMKRKIFNAIVSESIKEIKAEFPELDLDDESVESEDESEFKFGDMVMVPVEDEETGETEEKEAVVVEIGLTNELVKVIVKDDESLDPMEIESDSIVECSDRKTESEDESEDESEFEFGDMVMVPVEDEETGETEEKEAVVVEINYENNVCKVIVKDDESLDPMEIESDSIVECSDRKTESEDFDDDDFIDIDEEEIESEPEFESEPESVEEIYVGDEVKVPDGRMGVVYQITDKNILEGDPEFEQSDHENSEPILIAGVLMYDTDDVELFDLNELEIKDEDDVNLEPEPEPEPEPEGAL